MMKQAVCIHIADGEFAAQQIRAFLAAHEIPSEFLGEALRNTHALTLNGLGGVKILVDEDRADEARALLARVQAGELELDGSTPE
jgi:hypothetical protein